MDLDLVRRFYAGPWRTGSQGGMSPAYWTTEDDDPARVHHNVVISIDPQKNLNNGQPSGLAMWMDGLDLKPGARVLHVGCATGYYSAILGEAVGQAGHVWAVDVEAELVERAVANLSDLPQVSVACADGWDFDPGTCDAIFINAGATHPNPRWLACLAEGGTLVVPLTIVLPGTPHSSGLVLKVTRSGENYPATFFSHIAIYPLAHGRSEEWNSRLAKAMGTRQWGAVRSLRLDEHEPDETCFCHGECLCISKRD